MLFSTKAKNPRTAFRGFFYSVLLWRLNPQAGHRLFITIQPFDDVTAGSILLPSFTTPVFLLRLRRLSSTFSVNSHLTVLRHTPKAESMLAGPTENQASVHFRKKDTPACTFTCSTTDRGHSTTPRRFARPPILPCPPRYLPI